MVFQSLELFRGNSQACLMEALRIWREREKFLSCGRSVSLPGIGAVFTRVTNDVMKQSKIKGITWKGVETGGIG